MSIILKGIDMTSDGKPIRLVITSSGDVVEVWRDGLEKAYHPNSAIQIPKDHGRLIDENLTYIDKTIDGYFEIYAPTILEAET